MSVVKKYKLNVEIPFPTDRLAEIAYHVLCVDAEPKRSGITKKLSFNNNILKAEFEGDLARQLRVSVNGFFENCQLISETIEHLGEPVSLKYDYF